MKAELQHLARIAGAKVGRWTVTCPACRGRFRAFRPAGQVARSNAACPRCGALERRRLQWLYLRERTDLFRGAKRILHIAPEPCLSRRLSRIAGVHYVTADRAAARAAVCVDLTRIAFDQGSFGVILCSPVLEHIPDDAAAMNGLLRVLRPGGRAMLQVPVDESRAQTFEDSSVTDHQERVRLFGQWDHVRLFGQWDHVRVYGRDYADRLRRVGFDVHTDRFAFQLDARTIGRRALLPEPIYMCSRTGSAR